MLDARRGVAMFEKVNVPVLGVVENMSMYICPNCGHEAHPFGHGGAKAEAEALGVPCLAEIPLTIGIREQGRRRRADGCRTPGFAGSRCLHEACSERA